MTFISYAPNGEDVVLWRGLKSVNRGRYVDWSDERADGPSVTRAFYDQGWSGVLVRPASLLASLTAARPRDRVITAASWQHMAAPPHFLRIKLAGESAAALRRVNPARLRPWIVIVPANDVQCDCILQDAGYVQALQDGVNHIYSLAEHTSLQSLVAASASNQDNDLDGADWALADRLAEAEAALAAAEMRAAASSERLVQAVQLAGKARDDVRKKNEETAWLRELIDDAKTAEKHSRAEANWLRGVLDDAQQRAQAHANEANELRQRLAETEARLQSQARLLASWQVSTKILMIAGLRRLGNRLQPRTNSAVADAAAETVADVSPVLPLAPEPPDPLVAPPELPALLSLPRGGARDQTPPVIRAVHQFHAGSDTGDAITNSMLLIRSRLRAAGFRSEIFVESRGSGLGADIRPLAAMPEHEDYVLLFHYSMGFHSFRQVLDLPARKILVYHNITPCDLLSDIADVQRQAQLGRENLVQIRGRVISALADSAYNAVELNRLGFPSVMTCPLLFDVDAMLQRDIRPGRRDGVLTVLFVGRVTRSKSQDALVDAFAVFRTRFACPCRLVLVGKLDVDEHRFIAAVQQRIIAAGLQADVHLTGSVTDRELQDWYCAADLYISLSLHEGFGVPLVEAMAHGVPVVAWPAAAVPFTLGDGGILLRSRDPDDVAAAMLEAVEERPALAAKGYEAIKRWSLDLHLPRLMEALAFAGAVPPRPGAGEDALRGNWQFTIVGHVGKTYSLAAVNRGLAKTLEMQRPGAVRIAPVEGVATTDLREVPEPDRPLVSRLALRDRHGTGPELVLSGHYPVYVPAERGDVLAALFFWEESLIEAATVAVLNESFDAVFAPSRSVAKALVDSGVAKPVLQLGQAPELSRFAALPPDRERRRPFTFLHISSAFPRKGLDVLLSAWTRAFSATDHVRLVIKTFPNPHNTAADQISQLRSAFPGAAAVELLDEDISQDAMIELYRDASAVVLPSRGEGYNLPAAEAMAAGVPVIVTAHGGHMDFCTPDTARLVKRRLAASTSHLASALSLWAEPDLDDLITALREAAAGLLFKLVEPARGAILQATEATAFTSRLTDAASKLLLSPRPAPVRLTWVSSWGVRCGIAEYSRGLIEALPPEGIGDVTLFADDRTLPTGRVRPAWRLGDAASVDDLIAALAKADADVTVIQHQPMLLPWPWLGRVIDSLADGGRVAVVTLHNTSHLLDIAASECAVTVRALGRACRLLVHTLADVERLDGLGLAHVTTLLPHPAPAVVSATVRPLPRYAAPVIGCTGFFLPDKGIAELIVAAARLRAAWPGIQLRLVNAEYDDALSTNEIARCRELAAAEGLAVEWHTEFVSLAQQQRLLTGCDLLVLPYQRSKESSSAALRSAVATGIAVAVTPLPLFDEAEGAVFKLPGTGAEMIAAGMARLLEDVAAREALVAAARDWAAPRALSAVARRLHGMMLGLAAQARLGQPADGSLWRDRGDGAGG